MYEWVKVVHILAVISWMAALLYLPRLMVYHCETVVGSTEDERFKVMERRLLRAIATPAGAVALVSGASLLWLGSWDLSAPWISVKVLGVIGLWIVHGLLSRHRRQFAAGQRPHAGRYFRVLNEVPTALMVLIVIMVVVKPF